jgi:hypothetical protein
MVLFVPLPMASIVFSRGHLQFIARVELIFLFILLFCPLKHPSEHLLKLVWTHLLVLHLICSFVLPWEPPLEPL